MRKPEMAAVACTVLAVGIGIGFLWSRRVPEDSYQITSRQSAGDWFRAEAALPAFAPDTTPTPDASPAPDESAVTATPSPAATEPIDINTAGLEELQDLKGIGPALAQRIVDYRAEHGPFRNIEELKNVSGIGDAIFDGLKDSVAAR
jgi:competence ComEA-like helix-hairpin-helix protein